MMDVNSDKTADAAHEAFKSFLKKRGIKFTSPRKRILEAVLEMSDHFEAEQLLFALRQRGHRVAKATIYRTLPLLVECGILKQVRFDVKQAHYELCFGESAHDHMVCYRCGRIIEFASDEVIDLRRRIGRRYHFHVVSHRFQLSGLCWECVRACPAAAPLNVSPESAGPVAGGESGRGG
jgi:Fur family ferric uptake transcriptional regulator